LYRVPLIVRAPGLTPGRRQALTTAPDIPATILDLTGVTPPAQVQGRSVREVLDGRADEHRPFVISSWPLYFAKGELTSAVDSRKRRIASYMPVTVSNRRWSLIMGGPSEAPELYDLERDPQEASNVWARHVDEGSALFRSAVDFLRSCGTAEKFVTPREESLTVFAAIR
jgi:arylsulfatase A-like enzyme